MLDPLTPDDDCPRRRHQPTSGRGRVVTTETARAIASKLASGVGLALRVFAATGIVTFELYGELARLYDLRRPEAERYLDALTRYALRHQIHRDGGPGEGRAAR